MKMIVAFGLFKSYLTRAHSNNFFYHSAFASLREDVKVLYWAALCTC